MNENKINIKETFLNNSIEGSNIDPYKNLSQLNYAVNILSKQLTNYIKLDVMQQELKTLTMIQNDINKCAKKLNIFQEDTLLYAYKMGVLKTFTAILEGQEDANFKRVDNYFNIISSNKNYEKLLTILYTKNSINHGDLAALMNMSKSALTNMLKKVDSIDLFEIERRGKYKYYYAHYRTKEVYRKYFDKKTNKSYTQNEVYDIFNIFIKIILEEIDSNKKINSNIILKRLMQSNEDLAYYRKDFKYSIQNLVKKLNSKLERDYIAYFGNPSGFLEADYTVYGSSDMIKIRSDFND